MASSPSPAHRMASSPHWARRSAAPLSPSTHGLLGGQAAAQASLSGPQQVLTELQRVLTELQQVLTELH